MDSLKLYSPYVFHFELPLKKAVDHFFCIFVPLITGIGKIQESKVFTSIVSFLVQDLAFQALDFQLLIVFLTSQFWNLFIEKGKAVIHLVDVLPKLSCLAFDGCHFTLHFVHCG